MNGQTDRLNRWWKRSGIVSATVPPRFGIGNGMTAEASYLVPEDTARVRDQAARTWQWSGEAVPHVSTYIGPGSLAIFLGSRPETVDSSVWFHPVDDWSRDPGDLVFDRDNIWWRRTVDLIMAMRAYAVSGDYLVACPDLVENWDILASLVGASELLMLMIDEPEWVADCLTQIETVYTEVFDSIFELIKTDDDAMFFGPFMLHGRGRTAKVQCDGSAMFSPDMFAEFVLPGLSRQCAWLDRSLYHLDGTQCIGHLDHILSIADLDAVEWTPQAGIPGGTDAQWFPMYKKILQAGKSVQVLVDDLDGVPDLINAIGTEGVFLLGTGVDGSSLADIVARFRGKSY